VRYIAAVRCLVALAAWWMALSCAASAGGATRVLVDVPERVAAAAAARRDGDAEAPPPVLVLAGVRLRAGERITLEVRGAGARDGEPGPLLGTAATVGSRRDEPQPEQPFTLVVPLSDAALPLLADQRRVTLVLAVRGAPSRRVELERAYFDAGEAGEGGGDGS
jgi:hypothetical protein